MTATVLVTGAKGCIGAWTLRALIDAGHTAVALDLPGNMHRLDLILGDDLARVTLLDGDILDAPALAALVQERGITHICHLAGLQVPAARAKPTLGAQVNVVGTVNVFEAARAAGLKHVAYASSIAALNAQGNPEPQTLYGVWKLANEGTARVYHLENGIGSIGLRPYIVYGLGRDFGMTSAPTSAMLAAAAGQSYHIPYGGASIYHSGRDIGMMFMRAALADDFGAAAVFNPPGLLATMGEIVEAIHAAAPGVTVTYDDKPLPFPNDYDTSGLARAVGDITLTSLTEGVADTVEGFRRGLALGRVQPA
jgi:nucleoside-diphosphate-sugar epimerase